MIVEINVDAENIHALEQICKESTKTPSEIFNSFIKALYDACHSASGSSKLE